LNDAKYIGLNVHHATISALVLDFSGRLVMESALETKAATILQFFHPMRDSLHVTFEEGTWAAWLYGLIKPHVTELVVCSPRRNPRNHSKFQRPGPGAQPFLFCRGYEPDRQ